MASNDLTEKILQELKKTHDIMDNINPTIEKRMKEKVNVEEKMDCTDKIFDNINTQLDKLDYLFEMQVRNKIKREYGRIYAEKVRDTDIKDLLHLVGLKKSDFY